MIEKTCQKRNLALKRRLHVCCSYSETSIIPVLVSVARIRLVKTEDTSACVTVTCKMCRSAIVMSLRVVPSVCISGQ
jgi:hypothetical protein